MILLEKHIEAAHCPFCGEKKNISLYRDGQYGFLRVVCEGCGGQGPSNATEPVNRWNNRVYTRPLEET